MINQDKWIDSLLKTNIKFNEETNQIDHYRWINTISKKKTYNTVRKYSSVNISIVAFTSEPNSFKDVSGSLN